MKPKHIAICAMLICHFAVHAQNSLPKIPDLLLKPSSGKSFLLTPRNDDTLRFPDSAKLNNLKDILKQDPRFKGYLKKNPQGQLPDNGMPNVIKTVPPAVYLGNNGNGFDVYGSLTDAMPVLVPDSSFRSAMPNAIQIQPVLKMKMNKQPPPANREP